MATKTYWIHNSAMVTTAAPVKQPTGTAIRTMMQLAPDSSQPVMRIHEWGFSLDSYANGGQVSDAGRYGQREITNAQGHGLMSRIDALTGSARSKFSSQAEMYVISIVIIVIAIAGYMQVANFELRKRNIEAGGDRNRLGDRPGSEGRSGNGCQGAAGGVDCVAGDGVVAIAPIGKPAGGIHGQGLWP